uniref:Uncharacterized protein n=1 Tax=Ditylum brightwellii TaxID=49249 RepID=A0A7S4V0T2_9STRA|mmetsp:Transcript_10454/g.14008  ORF Transcript_10454/g.14008 Transcript_10454/m.14008 type:complete len:121 (+) Transcript_10454:77-439(+)
MNKALKIVLLVIALLQVGYAATNSGGCCQCNCTKAEATLDMPILDGPGAVELSDFSGLNCTLSNVDLKKKNVTRSECVKRCTKVGAVKKPIDNTCESSASRKNFFFGAVGAVVVMSGLLL